jgi:hypothetical protein
LDINEGNVALNSTISIAQMKAPYGICLYEAPFFLAVNEDMCPCKKKSFQSVMVFARTCARRLQELEGAGWGGREGMNLNTLNCRQNHFIPTHHSG